MEGITEKFIIRITDRGVEIRNAEKSVLHFTAGEALMLLDVLKSEEDELKRMAEEASPMPTKIQC